MRRDAALLDDIVQHCDQILAIVADAGQKQIASEAVLQAAILHQLTVIGEAAARLSREFCRCASQDSVGQHCVAAEPDRA